MRTLVPPALAGFVLLPRAKADGLLYRLPDDGAAMLFVSKRAK